MKKIFIISAVFLVIVLFFLGIYNFAFRENSQKTVGQPEKPAVPNVVKKTKKIAVVSDEPVLGPVLDKENEKIILYYSAKNGTVWKMSLDGEGKQQLLSTQIEGLKNVLWSPDRKKDLTTIEKDKQLSFFEYDHQTKKSTELKKGLDTAVWDNLGTKIFYKYYDSTTQERTINIANPDGSGWEKITNTDFRDVSIAPIPLTSIVSFWNAPKADEETQFLTIGVSGGDVQTVLRGRFGADYLWSPSGTEALVSSLSNKDSKMTTLGIVTLRGEYIDLGIPTVVTKCVWSADGKTIYYALPGEIPEGAIMPDDYQNKNFFTDDTFWKMDITTNKKERIIETSNISGKHDSINLFLSSTEDTLFFINRIDGKLYKVDF